jgi:hypothetical protein
MFKCMTDEALVEAYWNTRRLAADMAKAGNPRLGRLLRDIDIIVAVARRRGLDILRAGQ